MSLNVVSNFAANVAHRNLVNSDRAATSSLAKLASGKRVVSAKDDAASLAIGSRLNAEVQGLKQAQVNAGQAVSMLQIADGAMARIDDILVRMKTLALQASSGQLSDTERTILNTEYAQLLGEVGRITDDTEFNGTQLLKGGSGYQVSAGAVGTAIDVSDGFEKFSFAGTSSLLVNDDTVTISYVAATNQFTVAVTGGTAGSYTSSAIAGPPAAGEFLDVTFAEIGLTITLNSQFADANLTASTNTDFTVETIAGGDTLSLTFKVGTGTESQDDIIISVNATTTSALDSNLASSAINTSALAAVALTAVGNAIDTLASNRAGVGAAQNTLEFASANIATAVENAEAARSQLLDLDVAQEMSVFTSKQILVQTGIAMLAQANQLPQNLLRLFQ